MVKFVEYQPRHRQAILHLLDEVPFKGAIWDWQFEQGPAGRQFDPVVVEENGAVVGFNGAMPAQVKYGGDHVEAVWSCDFYVDASLRGQGVGTRIKEHQIRKAPLIMSFGVSQSAAVVLRRMGWKGSQEGYSYRRLHRYHSLRQRALLGLQFFNRITTRMPAKYAGALSWSDELPAAEEVDGLWAGVESGYEKIVCRDFGYMDWRYQKHPLARYRFLLARSDSGALEAVLVVRFHRTTLRIVDWLGPATAGNLKKAMVQACGTEYAHADLFTCTTSDREFGHVFRSAGFYRTRSRTAFFVRSSIEGDQDCEKHWFLMAGDSDGEILSAAAENFGIGTSEIKAQKREAI